jgi:hypothetical protein
MGEEKAGEVVYEVVACPQCGMTAKKYSDGTLVAGLPSFKVVCDVDPKHNWRWAGATPTK